MPYRRLTCIIMVTTLVLLIAWDFVAEFGAGDVATISGVTLHFFARHPAVCFAAGALVGHLSWPRAQVLSHAWHAILVCATLMGVAIVDATGLVPPLTPIIPLAIGVPFGHFVWAQSTALEIRKRDVSSGRFVR